MSRRTCEPNGDRFSTDGLVEIFTYSQFSRVSRLGRSIDTSAPHTTHSHTGIARHGDARRDPQAVTATVTFTDADLNVLVHIALLVDSIFRFFHVSRTQQQSHSCRHRPDAACVFTCVQSQLWPDSDSVDKECGGWILIP